MKRIISQFLAPLIIATVGLAQDVNDVRVTVDEVKDSRTTGQFFASLEIKLKLMSDSLDGVERLRAHVARAVDDTGRDLIDPKSEKDDFQQLYNQKAGQMECTLKLRNPARRASVVKELTGEIEAFLPKRDPAATVTVENFLAEAGKPLAHPTLKAANIEIIVLTKTQYDTAKAEEEKKAKESASKEGLAGAMTEAFSQMFAGFGQVSENSVILNTKDPQSQIIGVKFADEKGKDVSPQMTMTSGETKTYDFRQKLGPASTLKVFVGTPKALVKVPIKLTDIALP
jgi:hypothetical protein